MSAPASRARMPVRPALTHLAVASLIAAVANAAYLGAVALAGRLLPGLAVLPPRWGDVLVGALCYLLFAFDIAALQGRWFATFPSLPQRLLIQLGSALGTLAGKVAMFLIWQLLMPTPLLLGAMLLFALLLLPQVATLSLASAEERPWPAVLARPLAALLTPLSRLLLPLAGKVVRPLNLDIPATPRGTALMLAGLAIPFATIHEFLGFVVLYPAIQIAGFGVGAISANSLMSLWLLAAPVGSLRVLRSPFLAAPRAIALLALGLLGVFRLAALVRAPLVGM